MRYNERQIQFENGGEKIYGFLHLPTRPGPHPAVALLHGFGGNHIEPHALFPKAARAFAFAGVATLRFDFRGSGDSEGDFQDVTLNSEIQDAHCSLDYLASQPEIDAGRIGIGGLSLGGLIAACAAGSSARARTLFLWAAVAHLGELFQAGTAPERARELSINGFTDYGGLQVGAGLVGDALQTDPVAALSGFAGPVLVAHGSADETVPVEHAHRYSAALGDRAELSIVSGADHVFSSLVWERELIDCTTRFLIAHL